MWRGINQLLNKHRSKQKSIFLEDSGLVTDPKVVANKFNTYFINIAEKLSNKIVNKNTKFQDYLKNPNMSQLFLNETSPHEIAKIINDLNPKKSGDIYQISPEYVITYVYPSWAVKTHIYSKKSWLTLMILVKSWFENSSNHPLINFHKNF